jgi:hypothetical protein
VREGSWQITRVGRINRPADPQRTPQIPGARGIAPPSPPIRGYKWGSSATEGGSPCSPQEDGRAWSSPPRSGELDAAAVRVHRRQTDQGGHGAPLLRPGSRGKAGTYSTQQLVVSSHDSTSPRHGPEGWSSVAPPLAGRQRLCIRILRLSLLAEERMRAPTPCCAFPFPSSASSAASPSASLFLDASTQFSIDFLYDLYLFQ